MPATVMNALTAPAHWGWYFLAYIPAVILLGMALIRYIRKIRKESFTAREQHGEPSAARFHSAPGKLHGIPACRRQLY